MLKQIPIAAAALVAALAALVPPVAQAGAGSLVSVTVEVDGRHTPLYLAPDGSGRHYLEARQDRPYTVRIDNRTMDRLGVVLTIDGLNAVSGEREAIGTGRPGRMYVLDPWASTSVQGWRTSLSEVRRFTFVDEKASYAARTGKSNSRMGWIEIAVHREVPRPPDPSGGLTGGHAERERKAEAVPAPSARGDQEAQSPAQEKNRSADSAAGAAPSSFPGTGWGRAVDDRAHVVSFQAERVPAERITLRYEYRSALQALGVLPRPRDRDRLRERDSGDGFARPPAY